MATSVAAALAAELGLRTAAELRPAARPGREARRAGEPPAADAARNASESPAEPVVHGAAVAEPRPVAPSGEAIDPMRASRVILPVTPDISALLPHGGLATVTAIMASRRGATSLLWRLLAGPTRSGAWCALVGMPRVYPLAATAAGVDLGRVALVDPGPLVVEAAGTLAEGVAAVVVPSEGLTPTQTRRLAARARKSGTAIIWWETRPVAGADARLEVARARWKGLRPNAGRRWGAGRLDACELEVAAHWRTGGTHEARIWPYGGETAPRTHGNVIDLRSRSAMDRNGAADRAGGAERNAAPAPVRGVQREFTTLRAPAEGDTAERNGARLGETGSVQRERQLAVRQGSQGDAPDSAQRGRFGERSELAGFETAEPNTALRRTGRLEHSETANRQAADRSGTPRGRFGERGAVADRSDAQHAREPANLRVAAQGEAPSRAGGVRDRFVELDADASGEVVRLRRGGGDRQ
ncbi:MULTISPECIES: hypothetical protein [Glycomyces]|uniref:Protein ImuA n=2 Tax=Glycomyces TaxID=58113 RepID=A0A9X3T718_9ACTN|nr:hypothetical protein [Glycomyces lechevalierae]MDA1383713.1 hypothetical protein [Glycomyces lechevalierae]MDR7341296.1 hypothetical protein [Glycomyces lechevalierae]